MGIIWEEAEVAAQNRSEWRRSVAECIHLDAGWIKVKVKVNVITYQTLVLLGVLRNNFMNLQQNEYECTIDQELAERYRIVAVQTLRFHSPGGSTILREMTSWPPSWKCDVKSKIRLRQSMRIFLKIIPAKFHPDPIWNVGALDFIVEVAPTRRKTTKTTRWVAVWDQFLI